MVPVLGIANWSRSAMQDCDAHIGRSRCEGYGCDQTLIAVIRILARGGWGRGFYAKCSVPLRFVKVLSQIVGKRLTYAELTGHLPAQSI